MRQKHLIPTLTLLLVIAACSEQKDLHEMHDATVKMNETTGEMNKKTEVLANSTFQLDEKTGKLLDSTNEMNETTQQMLETSHGLHENSENLKNTTNELYDALRQGNSLQLRREAYDSVLKAPTLFKKLSEAAKYFMSFEVQLWNQYGQDGTEEKRDQLAQQAAQEFFLEIEDLAQRDGSIDPTAMPDRYGITGKQNRQASFNAMALAMHQMNRKQSTALEGKEPLQKVSMYSLMEEALLAKAQIASGADLGTKAGYIREVLAHEPKAIQLLQARYNTFPVAFIDFVSQISDKNVLVKAKMALLGWECNLDALNPSQIDYLQTEVLSQAVQSRNLLLKLGVKPKMDKTVARLLNKMKIKSGGQKGSAMAEKQTQLVGLIQELKKGL